MTENNTDAARTYRAVIVKRMASHLSVKPDGTPHSDLAQFESAMSSWVANLDRAQEQDFFMMWRDGKIFNAATVLGAERIATRFGGRIDAPEVRWITSMAIPAWLESLVGSEFEMPNRNPVFYITLHHDPVTGSVTITK